jgi:O-antigen/teichoic acid export membrane protein
MQVAQQAKKNLLTGYLHFFVFTSIFILLTPFYISRLGDQFYGYWSVLNSVIAYLATLDFGLGLASTKFTAETIASGDKLAKSRILSQILFLYLVIGIILIICGMVLSFHLPRFFGLPSSGWQVAALATFLMAVNLVFTLLSKYFAGICFGHQRQEVPNLIGVCSALLQGGFSYLFLSMGFGIVGLAASVIIAGLIGLILRAAYCGFEFHPLGLSFRLLYQTSWSPLFRFGGGVFITAIGGQIILNTDNILIGRLLDLKMVTAYSVVFLPIMAVSKIFQQISDVFFPVLTDNYTKSDYKRLHFYFTETSFLSMTGYTAVALGIACFGQDLMALWVGQEQFAGNRTMWVLLMFFWFQTFMHCHALLLMSAGKVKPIVQLNITEAIANFGLSIVLINYIGILGVALGSLLSIILTNYCFLPVYSAKILKIHHFQLIVRFTLPVIAPAVPVLGVGFLLKSYVGLSGPFQVLGATVMVSATYLFLMWLSIGSIKRSWYRNKFSALIRTGHYRNRYPKMDCSGNS